jgi:hypothetical protein
MSAHGESIALIETKMRTAASSDWPAVNLVITWQWYGRWGYPGYTTATARQLARSLPAVYIGHGSVCTTSTGSVNRLAVVMETGRVSCEVWSGVLNII